MQQESCGMTHKSYETAQNCYTMKTMDCFTHLLVTMTQYTLFSQVITSSLHSRGGIHTYYKFYFRVDRDNGKNIVKITYTCTYKCPSCMSWLRNTTQWRKLLVFLDPLEAPSKWKPIKQKEPLTLKQSNVEDEATNTILRKGEK